MFFRMFWDNANKPVLELLRNSWNSWTPWTSEIMQINWFWNSLHSLNCSWIFWYVVEMQKVTFSMCLLRCSIILNFCTNPVHTDSGKPKKSQGKLFLFKGKILSLQLNECLIKISTLASTNTMNSRNLCFMFS